MKYILVLSIAFFIGCESALTEYDKYYYCGKIFNGVDAWAYADINLEPNGTGIITGNKVDNDTWEKTFLWRDTILSYTFSSDSIRGIVFNGADTVTFAFDPIEELPQNRNWLTYKLRDGLVRQIDVGACHESQYKK